MTNNITQKNIPEIRFKGFENQWEKKTLGEIANFSKGQGYSKTDLVETGTPIVLYGRLYTKYQVVINEIDTYSLVKPKSVYSTGNEVVVPASGETSEDIARASAILSKDVLLGGDLNIIYPSDVIDSVFLALNISNGKSQIALAKRAQGKSVVHLRNTDLKEVTVNYPILSEQAKIGGYFQKLDKLINLSQTKYKKLQNLKKAMLEKMFPKNGSNVPEIRFSGFDDEWEEKTLGEVAEITMGQSPDGSNYTDNPEHHILVQGNADIKEGRVSPRVWTTQITKTADVGDLIFCVRAPVGDVGKTSYNVVIGRGVAAIKGNEFIFQSLKRMNENNFWKKFSAGSTFESINTRDLSLSLLLLPNKAEQQKIGDYFQNLDNLISLQQKELEKLKNIKKACLEKMFV